MGYQDENLIFLSHRYSLVKCNWPIPYWSLGYSRVRVNLAKRLTGFIWNLFVRWLYIYKIWRKATIQVIKNYFYLESRGKCCMWFKWHFYPIENFSFRHINFTLAQFWNKFSQLIFINHLNPLPRTNQYSCHLRGRDPM